MVSHRERTERSGNINLVLTLENTSLLCALCALRVNPALSLRHANLKVGVPKRIAPSRKEEALTPRCCARELSQR